MALELLTNREVIRTHRHWRLFMKRPVWSAESSLEKLEQKVDAELPTEMHRLEKLTHTTETDGTSSTVKLESSDSFYDCWLHRGQHNRVLRDMSYYVYGMYVQVVTEHEAMRKIAVHTTFHMVSVAKRRFSWTLRELRTSMASPVQRVPRMLAGMRSSCSVCCGLRIVQMLQVANAFSHIRSPT